LFLIHRFVDRRATQNINPGIPAIFPFRNDDRKVKEKSAAE
jgi:hypothetical protein